MSPGRPGRLTTGTTAPTTEGKNKYFFSSPGARSCIALGLSEAPKSTLFAISLRMPASDPTGTSLCQLHLAHFDALIWPTPRLIDRYPAPVEA